MATTSTTHHDRDGDAHRASPVGAYIATLGALVLLVSIFLNWVGIGPADREVDSFAGYEADGVVPFMAYLAIGFALALLYATKRADRRQHRGLSLASMAAGIAALLWTISFIIDPISTTQYNENVTSETGVYIAVVGALLWAVGSLLLAKEPEGDIERTQTTGVRTVTEARPATGVRTEHGDHERTLGHTDHTTGRTTDHTIDHTTHTDGRFDATSDDLRNPGTHR